MRFSGAAAAIFAVAKVSKNGSAKTEPPILMKERRVVGLVFNIIW